MITQKLFSPDSSNYFQDNKFHFVTPSKDAVSITFANGQVERITLNHNQSLPLSAMIDKLGEPEKVYMDTAGQHDVLCHVSFLYYPNQGVIVQSALCEDFHTIAQGQINNVMPDTPVTILHLSETAPTLEAMLSTLQLPAREIGQIRYTGVDWKGYGFYAP